MKSRVVKESVMAQTGMIKLDDGSIVLLDPDDSDCGTVIYSTVETCPLGTTMSVCDWNYVQFNGTVEITA